MDARASTDRELWSSSATDLLARLRSGEVSFQDVVRAHFCRIDEINPHLRAIVHSDRERALREARQADDLRARAPHETGPLHGLPVTIKLNADVAGEATSNGVRAYADRIATEDSAVVANLRRAGAVLVGRTNVPPFSFRWFTENPLHGRTLNPWNEQMGSGGSSGGAAVAVATGMCAISHGTDIAGSIRYPAYVNGVVGLRPTPGRVPAFNGTVGMRPIGLQLLSAQGPLARCVQDVDLALRAMACAGAGDPTWMDLPLDRPDDADPVRVALVDTVPGTVVDPDVRAALQQAAHALQEAGYHVEHASPPQFGEALQAWLAIVMTEVRLGMMAAVDASDDRTIQASVHAMAHCASR